MNKHCRGKKKTQKNNKPTTAINQKAQMFKEKFSNTSEGHLHENMCGNTIYASTELGMGWENELPTIWSSLMLQPGFWISQKLIFYLLLSHPPPSQQKESLKANISRERPPGSASQFVPPPAPINASLRRIPAQAPPAHSPGKAPGAEGLQGAGARQNILPHAHSSPPQLRGV